MRGHEYFLHDVLDILRVGPDTRDETGDKRRMTAKQLLCANGLHVLHSVADRPNRNLHQNDSATPTSPMTPAGGNARE